MVTEQSNVLAMQCQITDFMTIVVMSPLILKSNIMRVFIQFVADTKADEIYEVMHCKKQWKSCISLP